MSLPLIAWACLAVFQFPVSRGFLDVLVGYFPLSLFLLLYLTLTSYDLCTDRILGHSTKRVLLTMALLGGGGILLALITDSETLAALSTISALSAVEGLLIERERMSLNNGDK